MDHENISPENRALGTWIRAWQLAGHQWPPESRAIARQIVVMLANQLDEVARGALSAEEAFLLAREALSTLLAQRFYSGSEQDIAITRIQEAFEYAISIAPDQEKPAE